MVAEPKQIREDWLEVDRYELGGLKRESIGLSL